MLRKAIKGVPFVREEKALVIVAPITLNTHQKSEQESRTA
jgi:hypothetical protein